MSAKDPVVLWRAEWPPDSAVTWHEDPMLNFNCETRKHHAYPAASDPVRSMLDDLREAERFAASAAKVCDEAKTFARTKSVENEALRAEVAALRAERDEHKERADSNFASCQRIIGLRDKDFDTLARLKAERDALADECTAIDGLLIADGTEGRATSSVDAVRVVMAERDEAVALLGEVRSGVIFRDTPKNDDLANRIDAIVARRKA